jgi:hypothetical protein
MFTSVQEGRFELVSQDVPKRSGEPQQPYAELIRSTIIEPATRPARRQEMSVGDAARNNETGSGWSANAVPSRDLLFVGEGVVKDSHS